MSGLITRRSFVRGLIAAPFVVRPAFAQFNGCGPGFCQTPAAAAPTYQGPGDIIPSGWEIWAGLRAFSAATIGTKCARLQRSSDNTQKDINTAASGIINVSDPFFDGSTTYQILKMYDKSGNGKDYDNVGGTFVPPTLSLNDNGPLPCIRDTRGSFPSWSNLATTANSADLANPFTGFLVFNRTPGNGFSQQYSGNSQISLAADASVNVFDMANGGTTVSLAAADGSTHFAGGVFYFATNSTLYIDGATNTGMTSTFSSQTNPWGFPIAGSDGKLWETGWVNGDQSAHFAALNAQAHSVWNF